MHWVKTKMQNKHKAAEGLTTHRRYFCVFLHSVCITIGEVACDAQVLGRQVKRHGDGSPFLLHLHIFGIPVYKQTIKILMLT